MKKEAKLCELEESQPSKAIDRMDAELQFPSVDAVDKSINPITIACDVVSPDTGGGNSGVTGPSLPDTDVKSNGQEKVTDLIRPL